MLRLALLGLHTSMLDLAVGDALAASKVDDQACPRDPDIFSTMQMSNRLNSSHRHAVEFCTVSVDWQYLVCGDSGNLSELISLRPISVNAIDGREHGHLPSYLKYTPHSGPRQTDQGLLVDFLGFTIMHDLYCNPTYMSQPVAHAIRTRQCEMYKHLVAAAPSQAIQTQWPVVSEEYFEYSDILETVLDYVNEGAAVSRDGGNGSQSRKFAFIELGAGYGHFTFAAHRALMQKAPESQYKYLMVDVNADLWPQIQKLAVMNDARIQDCVFHHGYIGESSAADTQAMSERFGNLWGLTKHEDALASTINFSTLLDMYDMPCQIDMVDIDIQGSEYVIATSTGKPGLFYGSEVIDLMTKRVKRVHIGTHSRHSTDDHGIIKKFEDRGWKRVWFFQPGTHATSFGPVMFGDGVISYVNPNVLSCQ